MALDVLQILSYVSSPQSDRSFFNLVSLLIVRHSRRVGILNTSEKLTLALKNIIS